MAVRKEPTGLSRLTKAIAIVFGSFALVTLLQSALAMYLEPWWWCNATGSVTGADNCDVTAFNALAALWLVAGLGVGVMTLKRWYLPVAIVASLLLAVSLTRSLLIGGFYMAPAALWLGCAVWQWADDRLERVVMSSLLSAALVSWAFIGFRSLIHPPISLA